ncbi:CoaD Phosphopantetheine adenylyltransferase [Candidatus Methylopumilus universalis]|uniref:pantetheine-phosphate adenylyltransferase n=1 Tax=Candidatus Methylopumilus TaxID=1679002 RepID=UPI0011202C6D|nr:pantetheine-phosphate adenylyltransferase [Candidatus Methylopumilus planktonicus]QDD00613.1 pantetheine-phosphate adenylyltransferase [Candidatus Methylopumilus planktonicus]QDD01943.1 pantetheine-phosphate adenylyltransferase [Candidatus Methylopumilus planktonicus]QDD07207.1 pantetheine-phosphate adenylyltransferase [Candidatus Methylopumilus planktonicus]QDD08536.1 pantetheine-phosphate adenylyltransferase [Candidatus Methylopumilus planktonicus]QDD09859.1 pantetheine-phosphate adenylyl
MTQSNLSIAIYPGTFDPITLGHENIAHRAARIFDKIIVAVASNSTKKCFFSFEERVGLVKAVFKEYKEIEVIGFSGLLMDFVEAQNAQVVIRGLRAVSDFEYEFQLAGMNRKLYPNVETLFLTPSEQFTFVSSSLVREVATLGGNIEQFVSPIVKETMKKTGR